MKTRIAIIGTGAMANLHASRFNEINDCEISACCDIIPERVTTFAKNHKIPKAFTNTEDLFEFDAFDAVSIVTPDSHHSAPALRALQAKKHVLCEKPLAPDFPEASRMADAARNSGLVHMVNFSYRGGPAIQYAAELVSSGQLGTIYHVEGTYRQSWLSSKVWGDWKTTPGFLWRLSSAHGSKGVLGDLGVHLIDFATFPVGPVKNLRCHLKTFTKAPGDRVGEYPLDANDTATIEIEFLNGALGTLYMTRWATGYVNTISLRIFGHKGALEISNDPSLANIRICTGEDIDSARWQEIALDPTPDTYQRFINAIRQPADRQPDFLRGAEVQRILDTCFESYRTGTWTPLKTTS